MPCAVLDVNVNVSAVVGPLGHSRQAFEAWRVGQFTHLTSEHIVTHTLRKLRLPRIARYHRLSEEELRLLEATLRDEATVVPLLSVEIIIVTGDPEDDAVLATARLGQADHLVTGDRGLLALRMSQGVRIVSPRDFLTVLRR
jgi:putative PIN family toxin of toxin-antitoxin system